MENKEAKFDTALIPAVVLYSTVLLTMVYMYYRDLVDEITTLTLSYEYSYLLLVFVSISVLFVLSSRDGLISVSRGLYIARLILALYLVSISLILFIISKIIIQYSTELKILSLLIIAWSLASILFRFRGFAPLILLLASVALIPLPASLLDSLSIALSRLLGHAAAKLVGAKYVATSTGSYIYINTMEGVKRLDVTMACSGIVSLSSALAVTPILAYIISRSNATLARKIAALVAAVTTVIAIILIGNFIRIVLVASEVSKGASSSTLELFHQAPSALYVAAAIILAVLVSSKIIGRNQASLRSLISEDEDIAGKWPSGVFLAFAGLALASIALFALVTGTVGGAKQGFSSIGNISSFAELASNPEILFKKANITVVSAVADKRIAAILGETNVVSAIIEYNVTRYQAYIEIAESPTRFHSWSVCLGYQGYRIIDKYTITRDGRIVTIYRAERGNSSYVIAFTVLKIAASFGSTTHPVYIKLTLLKKLSSRENFDKIITDISNIISVVSAALSQNSLVYVERVEDAVRISYYTLSALIAYLIVSYIYSRRQKPRKRL